MSTHQSTVLRIEHPIPNVDAWKTVFDIYSASGESGALSYRILCPIDDPKHAIVDLEFDRVRQAEDFLGGLRKIWERADSTLVRSSQTRIAEVVESEEFGREGRMTDTSENIKAVQQVYEGFARGDFGIIARYFDPQVEIYQTELLPWGGHYHGHEGVAAFFAKLLANVESRVEISALIDAGDHIVETGRTRGRSKQTGETFDLAEVHVWKLIAGKVVEFRAYIDTPAMTAALVPSPV